MAGVVKDNANLFLDQYKNNYFGDIPGDIKEIILFYLVNAITKIQSMEQIDELCSQNMLYQYRLCDNVQFWKLIWTKNIADEIPNPKKLIKIIEDLKLDESIDMNHSLIIHSMGDDVEEYIETGNLKKYIMDLYGYSLQLYTYTTKVLLGILGFNKLYQKARNNDNAINDFFVDIYDQVDQNIIVNRKYWNDIDFVYDNQVIFTNITNLLPNSTSEYEKKIILYVQILINKGFDINQMFQVGKYRVNLFGYSILRVNLILFKSLLWREINKDEVSPGYDAESFLTLIRKKTVSVEKLGHINMMIRMLHGKF